MQGIVKVSGFWIAEVSERENLACIHLFNSALQVLLVSDKKCAEHSNIKGSNLR